jgi:hypothetical protein
MCHTIWEGIPKVVRDTAAYSRIGDVATEIKQ